MSSPPAVVVVGCGHWGANLVRNFAATDALAGVVDADAELAARTGEEYGVTSLDLEGALASPDVDALAIAAPASAHAELARRALESGKDVFVEKPLALEVADGEAICRLAEDEGRVLMVGHLLRYHPAFERLLERVAKGDLGRLQYVYSNRLNLGRIRREEDSLWSFAPHDISMILALTGAEPDRVTAVGAKYLHRDIADVTTTHMEFAGGERAHVFVSWLHPYKEQKLIVVGEAAMAVFDDGEDWSAKLQMFPHRLAWRERAPLPVAADAVPVALEPAEPLREEVLHFLASVTERTRPRTDGREGLRVLRVLDAARRSMQEDVPFAARAPALAGPPPGLGPEVMVHESAYVDEDCQIGPGTRIWHFSHLLRGTRVGRDCSLGQNVMVGPDVTIGDRCKIQNNVSVYRGVTLDDGVFCGPSCVFTNVVNPRSEVERKDEFRATHVGRGATIGANATVVCGNDIGAYAFVAAGAVVASSVPAHALVAGVPAERVGWVSHAGERLGPDLVCPRTGRRYQEVDTDGLEEVEDG